MGAEKSKSKRFYIPILICLQLAIIFFIYNVNENLRVVNEVPKVVTQIMPDKCLNSDNELVPIKLPQKKEDLTIVNQTSSEKTSKNEEGINQVEGSANVPDELNKELCPEFSDKLTGSFYVDLLSEPDCLEDTVKNNPEIKDGGHYIPDCKPRHKVAIIIPFRKRDQHLLYFLQYMHPVLQRQEIEYKIFVINQYGDDKFNKDKLMNIGFVETVKDDFHCYVFHDVDMILTNDRCVYACQSMPVHYAHNVDKFDGLVYNTYFGGAVGFSESQFRRINGFPNNFLGWGGEDDVIYERVQATGMTFFRHDIDVAKYKMIHHERDRGNEDNDSRFLLLQNAKETYLEDGLNTLPNTYKVIDTFVHPLFTKITVDVNYKEHSMDRRSIKENYDTVIKKLLLQDTKS